jgi:uncharacterized protein YukE
MSARVRARAPAEFSVSADQRGFIDVSTSFIPHSAVANYDAIKLYVNPNELKGYARSLRDDANDIVNNINDIQNTFGDLKLGWAGKTADEAESFNDQWNSTMKELFGTKDDPGTGVLSAILMGVTAAASGYAYTEQAISTMFRQFSAQLSGAGQPSDGTQPSPTQDITDTDTTAVTETW